MKFTEAVDLFVVDMWSQGRFTSPSTERSYRSILDRHADDVTNRDPRYIGRDDIKRTLRRWPKANTQRVGRSILISFYDWMMEEGYRTDNPARMTRRPKKQPTSVYRLTRQEAAGMLQAVQSLRELRAIHIGICAGLRNAELRGLQGRHFRRPGFIWVSSDIAKGGRERWVPVIADLAPVADDIARTVIDAEYVLPAMRWRNPPFNTVGLELTARRSSSQALRRLVMEVAKRAGINAHVHPHLMRHAYGDHVARYAGMRNAQFLLGHASVGTTETYVGKPTLDELSASVIGFGFMPIQPAAGGTHVLGGLELAVSANKASTGIEPVQTDSRRFVQHFIFDSPELRETVARYASHFEKAGA